MILLDLYHMVVNQLSEEGIPGAEIEAQLLLGHVFKKSRASLFLAGKEKITDKQDKKTRELLARRLKREPLAYITGEKEFWSLPFHVTPDVLVPRPETEQLIEKILQTIKKEKGQPGMPILDLGVGSGVISIVLALELADVIVYGVDRSCAALGVAVSNARRHGVEDRVRFLCSNWLAGISAERKFGLVVSNPPYVSHENLATLQPELDFEPRRALDGGRAGLEEINRIVPGISKVLLPGGWLFMEIGAEQVDYLENLFDDLNEYDSVCVHKDYAGLPRIFQARLVY